MGARGRLCISLWRFFECVRVRVTLNQENGWAHLPKPCFQLDGPTISKIKLLRLVFACFSPCIQKHRTLVRCFCCVSFLSTHFVLSVKYRCRTRPGPRAAGRRVCAVRVFWPQAKTSAQAEFTSAEHFKISRYPKRNTSQQAGVSFWRCHPDLNWGVELLQSSALPLGYGTGRSGMLQKNWSE